MNGFPSPLLVRSISRSHPIHSSELLKSNLETDGFPFPTEEEELIDEAELGQELSNLDRSLEEIGIQAYQKRLLVLCGMGWAADNVRSSDPDSKNRQVEN